MALSAPLLWLIVPVGLQSVERDPGGRVVHRLTRPVGPEEPARLQGGQRLEPGRLVGVGESAGSAPASPRRRRSASGRSGSAASRCRPAAGEQGRIEAQRLGDRRSGSRGWCKTSAPRASAPLLRGPGVPQRPRLGPGQDRPVRPGRAVRADIAAIPSANWRSTSARRPSRGAADVGREPEHGFGGGVGTVDDQPGRAPAARRRPGTGRTGTAPRAAGRRRRAAAGPAGRRRTAGRCRANAA